MLLQSDDKQPWARGGMYNRWRLPDMCLARRLAAQHSVPSWVDPGLYT